MTRACGSVSPRNIHLYVCTLAKHCAASLLPHRLSPAALPLDQVSTLVALCPPSPHSGSSFLRSDSSLALYTRHTRIFEWTHAGHCTRSCLPSNARTSPRTSTRQRMCQQPHERGTAGNVVAASGQAGVQGTPCWHSTSNYAGPRRGRTARRPSAHHAQNASSLRSGRVRPRTRASRWKKIRRGGCPCRRGRSQHPDLRRTRVYACPRRWTTSTSTTVLSITQEGLSPSFNRVQARRSATNPPLPSPFPRVSLQSALTRNSGESDEPVQPRSALPTVRLYERYRSSSPSGFRAWLRPGRGRRASSEPHPPGPAMPRSKDWARGGRSPEERGRLLGSRTEAPSRMHPGMREDLRSRRAEDVGLLVYAADGRRSCARNCRSRVEAAVA